MKRLFSLAVSVSIAVLVATLTVDRMNLWGLDSKDIDDRSSNLHPQQPPDKAWSRQGAERESRSAIRDSESRTPQEDVKQLGNTTLAIQRPDSGLLLDERAAEKLVRRGTLIGSLEGADEKSIWGFAYDWAEPGVRAEVWVYIDGTLADRDVADRLRSIGKAAPYDVQERGFSFESPEILGDGREHVIRVLARLGRDYAFRELQGSPKRVGGNRPPEGTVVEYRDGKLIGWARDPENPGETIQVEILRDGNPIGTWQADLDSPSGMIHPEPKAHWFEAPIALEEEPYTIQIFANDPDLPGLRREFEGSPWTLAAQGEEEDNKPPYGVVAFIDTDQISGWAVDPDAGGGPIAVEIHFDGQLHDRLLADQPFPALAHDPEILSINHLWQIEIPGKLQDGETHIVSVFAINFPPGANPELTGSPATFTGKRNTEPVGYLDIANARSIAGWAYDADAGPIAIEVEIWIDGELQSIIVADGPRPDLVPAVSLEPHHGWSISAAGLLDDGDFHTVRAFARNEPGGMPRELMWSPRELRPLKPWLGASIGQGEGGRGVEILSVVEGGPADAAGIHVSDLVVTQNEIDTLSDTEAFLQWLQSRSVGEQITLTVERRAGASSSKHTLVPVLGLNPSP